MFCLKFVGNFLKSDWIYFKNASVNYSVIDYFCLHKWLLSCILFAKYIFCAILCNARACCLCPVYLFLEFLANKVVCVIFFYWVYPVDWGLLPYHQEDLLYGLFIVWLKIDQVQNKEQRDKSLFHTLKQ